jgi:peptidoglycan hydrolase-like protein with peptidoglycan-binding domain
MPAGLNPASARKLANVKAALVKVCERAAELSEQAFQIVQGNRTQAEQNRLYEQGRSRPGNIVTWTKNSKHIGGNAIDFAALVNGKINWKETYYPKIAEAFKQAARELGTGIEWGGDWKTKDWGHIQLAPKPPTPTKPTAGIGWTIADIQSALIKHGFKPGMIDGIMGPKTRAALKAFQQARGLEGTGGPNKATTDALAKEPPPAPLPGSVMAGPGASVPVQAVQTLRDLGWSRRDAVALVANMMWESGGHSRNTIKFDAVGDRGNSRGGGQWNKAGGRYQAVEDFAKALGKPWTDGEAQVRFLNHELGTTEKRAAKAIRAAATLDDAVDAAALRYWRPGKPHLSNRRAIAKRLDKEVPA